MEPHDNGLDEFQFKSVEPDTENRPPRKSKARERIERRRQQIQGDGDIVKPMTMLPANATPRATPRVKPQVVPTGKIDFNLSNLPLQQLRLLLYLGGAVLLALGVIVGLSLFTDEEVQVMPNAIWVGTEWTYENRGEAAVAAFAQKLRDHSIGTVYAWVSWINVDSEWAGNTSGAMPFSEREASVQEFVRQFKAAYPEAVLYGWVGFPTEAANIPYRLNDPAVHDEVAKFSLRVVNELGFDGVFLNVEPVWNKNSEDFVKLLSRVRVEIGSDAPISVAIPPDWTPLGVNIPQPRQVTPGTEWEKPFKQRVALLTDELAIMAYNSGLGSPVEYIDWMAYQVESYARAVDELDIDTRVVIGIPTYDNELPGHDVMVENVSSAVTGFRKGLSQAENAARVVSGMAIYADWTTDETEWLQFRQGWGEGK